MVSIIFNVYPYHGSDKLFERIYGTKAINQWYKQDYKVVSECKVIDESIASVERKISNYRVTLSNTFTDTFGHINRFSSRKYIKFM